MDSTTRDVKTGANVHIGASFDTQFASIHSNKRSFSTSLNLLSQSHQDKHGTQPTTGTTSLLQLGSNHSQSATNGINTVNTNVSSLDVAFTDRNAQPVKKSTNENKLSSSFVPFQIDSTSQSQPLFSQATRITTPLYKNQPYTMSLSTQSIVPSPSSTLTLSQSTAAHNKTTIQSLPLTQHANSTLFSSYSQTNLPQLTTNTSSIAFLLTSPSIQNTKLTLPSFAPAQHFPQTIGNSTLNQPNGSKPSQNSLPKIDDQLARLRTTSNQSQAPVSTLNTTPFTSLNQPSHRTTLSSSSQPQNSPLHSTTNVPTINSLTATTTPSSLNSAANASTFGSQAIGAKFSATGSTNSLSLQPPPSKSQNLGLLSPQLQLLQLSALSHGHPNNIIQSNMQAQSLLTLGLNSSSAHFPLNSSSSNTSTLNSSQYTQNILAGFQSDTHQPQQQLVQQSQPQQQLQSQQQPQPQSQPQSQLQQSQSQSQSQTQQQQTKQKQSTATPTLKPLSLPVPHPPLNQHQATSASTITECGVCFVKLKQKDYPQHYHCHALYQQGTSSFVCEPCKMAFNNRAGYNGHKSSRQAYHVHHNALLSPQTVELPPVELPPRRKQYVSLPPPPSISPTSAFDTTMTSKTHHHSLPTIASIQAFAALLSTATSPSSATSLSTTASTPTSTTPTTSTPTSTTTSTASISPTPLSTQITWHLIESCVVPYNKLTSPDATSRYCTLCNLYIKRDFSKHRQLHQLYFFGCMAEDSTFAPVSNTTSVTIFTTSPSINRTEDDRNSSKSSSTSSGATASSSTITTTPIAIATTTTAYDSTSARNPNFLRGQSEGIHRCHLCKTGYTTSTGLSLHITLNPHHNRPNEPHHIDTNTNTNIVDGGETNNILLFTNSNKIPHHNNNILSMNGTQQKSLPTTYIEIFVENDEHINISPQPVDS